LITVAGKEFRETMRDGRIMWSAIILILMLIAAMGTAAQRYMDISYERSSAQEIVNIQFANQGEKNPHAAAHYGIYAFKSVRPLSFFDTGISSYTGVSVWLEAHKQNEAEGEPARDATAMERFGELTPAFTLQTLLPLLVILLAFPAFSGERENGTLRQVMSMQVSPVTLFFGKALGFSASLAVFIGPIIAIGLLGLFLVPEGRDFIGNALILIVFYISYAMVFLFLTLSVSANLKSSQSTLVAMVIFWAISSFVMPRIASDLSGLLYPTPASVTFQKNIDEAIQVGLDGISPDTVIQQRQEQMLKLYDVNTVEELPINFQGVIFDLTEKLGNRVFDKFYGELNEIVSRQVSLFQAFSIVSPRMALQTASMELSGTSINHHNDFISQAEIYRRALINQMNQDIIYNSQSGQADYRAGPELWSSVKPFEYNQADLTSIIISLGPSFVVMILWLGISIVSGIIAVRRIKVTLT